MADLDFSGKAVVITGGASGIGLGAARAFSARGASLGLIDLPGKSLNRVAADFGAEGLDVATFGADVSDASQVQGAIDSIAQRFGRIDVCFANAGINGVWAPIEELAPEEFDHTIAVNLRGTFLTIKYAVPHLKRQGGSVIVTSSVNGTRIFSNTGATAYSASKAAQVAVVKMLAVELGQLGIRVNAICPGAIETNIDQNTEQRHTDQIKIPVEYPEGADPLTGDKPGSAQQVGRLALFLASDLADHINGEVVYIDGGESLVQG